MAKFYKVKRFENEDITMPSRATVGSAGYDLTVAEDIEIPTWTTNVLTMLNLRDNTNPIGLEDLAKLTKATGAKPTLVSTGVKCALDYGTYLELSVRSSTPLKHWLILANGVGRL